MKNKLTFIITYIIILILSLSLTSCTQTTHDFDTFVDQLFIEEIKANPMDIHYILANPSSYGLDDITPSIPDFTEETFNDNIKRAENVLKILKAFNYQKLTQEEQLTYDIISTYYENILSGKDLYLYNEVISPTLGIQAQLPIFFAEYRFDSEKDVVDYLQLLEEIPSFFEQIITFEEMKSQNGLFMPLTSAEAVIDQINQFIKTPQDNFLITIFNEKLMDLSTLSERDKQLYVEKNEDLILNSVIPAYKDLLTNIEILKSTSVNDKGLYYLEKGNAYYTYLYNTYTGSSKTIDETIVNIDKKIQSNFGLMVALIQNNQDLIEAYMSHSYDFDSPEETLAFLESAMQDTFSPIGAQALTIKYVHPSLEENLSPAFYLIPPIDESKRQIIYINQNEKYHLESQLYPTLAHEGYPGHLYQNVYFRQQNVPEIRQYLNFDGYSEGWATYVENEAIDFLSIDENLKKIIELDNVTNLLIQARIDLGVHYEGWTVEDTENYLTQYIVGADAQLVYDYVLQEPANVLKYAVGYLEFIDLREKAETKNPNLSLKAFHDFLLKTGPAPFEIIEKALDQWLENEMASIYTLPLAG